MELIKKYMTVIKYIMSSGVSFIVDLTLFTVFQLLFKNIILATIMARIISSLINFTLNKRVVFNYDNEDDKYKSMVDYFSLVIIQMLVSAVSVDFLHTIIPISPSLIKIPVETMLFICNYIIQKLLVFKSDNDNPIINRVLLSIFATIALIGNNLSGEYIKWLDIISNVNIFIIIGVFIFCLFLFNKFYESKKLGKLYNGLLAVFSFTVVLLISYDYTHTSSLFFSNFYNFLISIAKVVGFYFLGRMTLIYLDKFMFYKINDIKKENKLVCLFNNHPFLTSFSFLFICYSIYLIAFYPGILNYDNANQIKEVMGMHTRYLDAIIPLSNNMAITNFNPLLHTLLLGKLFKLGYLLGNVNLGLFIYTIIQVTFVISTISFAIFFLKREGVSNKNLILILLCFGLIPVFPFYAITAVKDVLYTSALILYSLMLYHYLKYKDQKFIHHVAFLMIIALVCLLRNNGLVIVLLTLPFLAFKRSKKMPILIIFILTVGGLQIYNSILLPYLNVSNTSVREVLSIPFQQTARLVKYKGNEISKEDQVVIDKILDYPNLSTDYNEDLADPVKNKYNKYATKEDLENYFKVWFKGMKKEPGIYLDATINNISGYFNPYENKWKVYYKLNPKLPEAGYNYHYNKLNGLRNSLITYEKVMESMPGFNLFTNIAFISWFSLLLFVVLIKYSKNYYIFLIPNVLQILMCILSPANTYFRYIYPSLCLLLIFLPLTKLVINTSKD